MFCCGDGRRTAVDLLRRERVLNFGDSEVGRVTTLAFLYIHHASECVPHAVFPFQVVFLHALVVIAFTALTDTGSTHLCKVLVDLLRDNVVMFVCPVAKAENDIFETAELMFTLAELEGLIGKVLHELHSIIGRFAFTICCHHENCGTIFWNFVQILKVVFFRIADERSETKLGLGFLSDTNGVFFGGPSL
jgi:hypothetical protein